VRILAVDADSAHASLLGRHCRAILAHRLKGYDVAATCEAAAARLAESAFDLVMLDPGGRRGDGFTLIAKKHVPAERVLVVSAHTDLAMRAFDYGVVDFVPKPVQRARLARALGRLEARHQPTLPGGPFLSVRRTGRIDLVPLDRIAWARGADKYSELTLVCGRKEFCDRSLSELGLRLPAGFLRVHRSYMVRVALIARLIVQRGSRYCAELHSGQRVPVGRSYYARLKARCAA
jgi:DNA-binding LytR/AlgR family response regulator